VIETRNIAMKCDAKQCRARVEFANNRGEITQWATVYGENCHLHYCPKHANLAYKLAREWNGNHESAAKRTH
jgi:hypothetical protein